MATLVHLTPERYVSRILRRGINAGRGVFCMPVLPQYYVTHQWLRELKRFNGRTMVAIYFQVPANQPILVGHFGQPHQEVPVDEAVRVIQEAADALGYECILQRPVASNEIVKVRRPSQVLGWRYYPDAKGRVPCGCSYCARGEVRSRKRQDAYEPPDSRTYNDLLQELQRLQAASQSTTAEERDSTAAEMSALLYEIGSRRAGSAGDLAFLLDTGDVQVLTSVAHALGRMRSRQAREMLARLCVHPAEEVREESALSLYLAGSVGRSILARYAGDPVIDEVLRDVD